MSTIGVNLMARTGAILAARTGNNLIGDTHSMTRTDATMVSRTDTMLVVTPVAVFAVGGQGAAKAPTIVLSWLCLWIAGLWM